MSRTRYKNAERKQAKAEAAWNPEENAWKKKARCGLCRHTFVVNNYPDRKVRVDKHKIGGVIVCPWCRARQGKFHVQTLKVTQQVALGECDRTENRYADDCKCLPCMARRILIANNSLSIGMK